MKPNVVFLDFTYYKGEQNETIVKELAYIDLCGKIGFKSSFSAPYSVDNLDDKTQYMVKWCQKYLHTLPFNVGERPYLEMNKTLLKLICSLASNSIIYVKGTDVGNRDERIVLII